MKKMLPNACAVMRILGFYRILLFAGLFLWTCAPVAKAQVLCDVVPVPQAVQVDVGESFQITLQVQVPPGGAVTVADIFMEFNPEVVNVTAMALSPTSLLPLIIQTSIDNIEGKLNFVAFAFNSATTNFDFITIDLIAVNDGFTLLQHVTDGFPVSQLAFAGENVTGQLLPASINVGNVAEPDCLGVPNGDAAIDECGVCYPQGAANSAWNTTCADCLGVPNGDAAIDECEVCYPQGAANSA